MDGLGELRMSAEGLSLAPVLCDGMVMQRDAINLIYGTETLADAVTVSFMGTGYSGRVDEKQRFYIELPPVPAGGPCTITVTGSGTVTITDILFGDVFLLAGQSNMELPLRRVMDVSGEELAAACEPFIRQYQAPRTYNYAEPEEYMAASVWIRAAGEELLGFSALGYFFAKEIREHQQVPVGLILTAVGGSRIEAWMKPETLRRYEDYEDKINRFKNPVCFNFFQEEQQKRQEEWLRRLEEKEKKYLPAIQEDRTQQNPDIPWDYWNWDICRVPSLGSDYGCKSFCGSVYLCREVYLKEEPGGEDACIYMGSIIDSDRVWINGELIGRTEYRYPPRKYTIPKGILRKGKNLVTVRIVINTGNGGTIKGKPYHLFCGGMKYNLEGDWYYRIGAKADNPIPEVIHPHDLPTGLYHTVAVPFSRVPIKGILWYQGESNTHEPADYARKAADLVADWRALYGWEVPFLYVQLANYREPLNTWEDTGWAELREQQRQGLTMGKTAMAVTLDIGEYNDLHPQNKKEVGIRLSRAARSIIYNEDIIYSGPLPEYAQLAAGGNIQVNLGNLRGNRNSDHKQEEAGGIHNKDEMGYKGSEGNTDRIDKKGSEGKTDNIDEKGSEGKTDNVDEKGSANKGNIDKSNIDNSDIDKSDIDKSSIDNRSIDNSSINNKAYEVHVRFRFLEQTGIECRLNNFELAGKDGIYYSAAAIRKGDYVTVTCDAVECPVSVRYAWCSNPENINFYNEAGLPAPGFRIDISAGE